MDARLAWFGLRRFARGTTGYDLAVTTSDAAEAAANSGVGSAPSTFVRGRWRMRTGDGEQCADEESLDADHREGKE